MLPLSMLVCGWLSVWFGKELCWDLAHYHYYTPFAFLHSRQGIDFWPNSYIHQFINPTIDLLSYFLINSFTPRTAEFILGALHGINLWLAFLIARRYLPARTSNWPGVFNMNTLLAIFLAALGLYGPTALPGIGSFQNDNLVSIFVLGFVLLQIRALDDSTVMHKLPVKPLLISGFILGLGFGLKLTAGIYVAGATIATLILPVPVNTRLKWLLLWGFSTAIGMSLTAGHWMYLMWQQHHNPFFPFFNSIFHSPDFVSINWRDQRFLPQGILQTLFFPFYFALDGRTADAPFRDFRFPVVFVLFVLAGIQWAWMKPRQKENSHPQNRVTHTVQVQQYWLFAFFIFSYLVWQFYFSIARYLVVLEILSPLVIFLLIRQVINNIHVRIVLLVTIFYSLIILLSPIPMVRAPWYDTSFFNVRLPQSVYSTPKATVLITYTAYVMDQNPRPQSYLIPFFPSQWHFIGVPFWHERYLSDHAVSQQITSHLHHAEGKIYLLSSDMNMPAFYQAAQKFGLIPAGKCEKILSDRQAVTHQNVLLCEVRQL